MKANTASKFSPKYDMILFFLPAHARSVSRNDTIAAYSLLRNKAGSRCMS